MVSQISKSGAQAGLLQQQSAPNNQQRKPVTTAKPAESMPEKAKKDGPQTDAQARQASRLKADSLEVARSNRIRREKAAEESQRVNTRTQIKQAYEIQIKSEALAEMNSANDLNEKQKVKEAAAQAAAFDEAIAEAEAIIDEAQKIAAAAEVTKVENREADAALTKEREAEAAYQNEVAMGRLSDRRELVHILRAATEEGSARTAEARDMARVQRDLVKMERAAVRQEEEVVKSILDKLEIAEEAMKKSARVISGTRPHQTTEGAFEEDSSLAGHQDKTLGLVPLAFRETPVQHRSGAFSDRNEPVIDPANLDLSDKETVEKVQASIQEAQERVASFQQEAEAAAAVAEKKVEKATATLESRRSSPAIGNAEEARRVAEELARQTAQEPERMIATQRFITTQSALQVLN